MNIETEYESTSRPNKLNLW